MPTYDPQSILDDFTEFRAILDNHLQDVPADAWDRRTGEREKDWTLKQTLAHLAAIAGLFNLGVDAALSQTTIVVEGLTQRVDLRDWNEAQIAARESLTVDELTAQLFGEFDKAMQSAPALTQEQPYLCAFPPTYNRPARVVDFIEWQLSHAGVIHASQITRPLDNNAPLWEQYSPELLQRQIDRFLRQFSYAYWPDYSDGLEAAINFYIGGDSGGEWHIIANPDGGSVGKSAIEDAAFKLHFANPGILFGVFNIHIPIMDALTSGDMQVEGDISQMIEIIKLFAASPPKSKRSAAS
jgi:hypothetical protein